MRLQALISTAALSLLFIGCNDDISRNRSTESNGGQTQTKETVTTYSGIHRSQGTSLVTYATEINIDSDATNLRAIPDIRLDDEGADYKNVNTRTEKVRPSVFCGLTVKATLKEKLTDCATKNADKAVWNGTTEAGSAEALWSLVTLGELPSTGEQFEVWLDGRTGMVWSHIIDLEANWCQASGSQLTSSDNVGENCAITGKGQKLCSDLSIAELPGVTWRLPTRHDYLQADIDGIRFVLIPGVTTYWTATTSSDVTARDKAWTYNMVNGTLVAELMNSKRSLRCIGTPNF